MFLQPYEPHELRFAWCYRVYCRWQTRRTRPEPALAGLTAETLDAMLQPYDVRILECSASETDIRLLASLSPTETLAACAGKIKGRVSKWLRAQLPLLRRNEDRLLSRGYFACTTGQSTAQSVDGYLQSQGEHHGYLSGPCPPVFVARYPLTPADERRLETNHAVAVLQFHVVLATWRRQGIFGRAEAAAVAESWRRTLKNCPMVIEKVSFVPDHVHLAVRAHPTLSPAAIAVDLMNAAQQLMWKDFADSVIRAGVERLWQPSAYLGSYGELESAKIAAYVRRWQQRAEEP